MDSQIDELLSQMHELRESGSDFCVATIVRTADASSAKAGAKAIVTNNGQIQGYIGGNCVQNAVTKAAKNVLSNSEPELIRVKPKEKVQDTVDHDGVALFKSSCPSGGTVDIFIEPIQQCMRLLICGSSPVANYLLRIGEAMGYQTYHLNFNSQSDSTTTSLNSESSDLNNPIVSERDCVIVATQGRNDQKALTLALNSNAGYIAFIGSKKKIEKLKEQLSDKFTKDQLSKIHSPAGLDLGAVDAPEIALSIYSEILAIKRNRIVKIDQRS